MTPSCPIRFFFFVEGSPRPQPRPRATSFRARDGQHRARVYNAPSADEWKARVIAQARPYRPARPIRGPLTVHLTFCMPRPGRLQRRKDPDGPIPHAVKPDKDNLEKAIFDCLTDDGWWEDDAQIYAGQTEKWYAAKGEKPGVWIEIVRED